MRRKSDKAQADWSEEMVSSLVEVLLDEVRLGKRADTGFKGTSFERALLEINQKVDGKGLPPNLDVGQVKSKLNTIKKDYDLLITIKGYSGVGWDDEKAMVLAEPSVWDRILLLYPRAKKFRKIGLPRFQEYTELFEKTRATGEFAITPSQLSRQSSPPWPDDLRDEDTSPTSSPQISSDNNTQSSQASEFPLTQSPGVGIRPSFLIQATQRQKRRNRNHQQDDDIESSEDFPEAKRLRRSAGQAIAHSLNEIKETAQTLAVSKTERAIAVFFFTKANLRREGYSRENKMWNSVKMNWGWCCFDCGGDNVQSSRSQTFPGVSAKQETLF
ncbi:hypothetical protein BZA77DRAFT_318728 [Pyronema omphalodes]|nr:hypothetical protein BZA77DRAFT_318728 [Pyronema omphalodes]